MIIAWGRLEHCRCVKILIDIPFPFHRTKAMPPSIEEHFSRIFCLYVCRICSCHRLYRSINYPHRNMPRSFCICCSLQVETVKIWYQAETKHYSAFPKSDGTRESSSGGCFWAVSEIHGLMYNLLPTQTWTPLNLSHSF